MRGPRGLSEVRALTTRTKHRLLPSMKPSQHYVHCLVLWNEESSLIGDLGKREEGGIYRMYRKMERGRKVVSILLLSTPNGLEEHSLRGTDPIPQLPMEAPRVLKSSFLPPWKSPTKNSIHALHILHHLSMEPTQPAFLPLLERDSVSFLFFLFFGSKLSSEYFRGHSCIKKYGCGGCWFSPNLQLNVGVMCPTEMQQICGELLFPVLENTGRIFVIL